MEQYQTKELAEIITKISFYLLRNDDDFQGFHIYLKFCEYVVKIARFQNKPGIFLKNAFLKTHLDYSY